MIHVYLMHIVVVIGDVIQYIMQKHLMTDLRQSNEALLIERY